MLHRYFIFIAFCVGITTSASGQCTSNRYTDTVYHQVQKTTQILFGTADNNLGISQNLYLDFYEPKNDTLLYRPLIIYAFGGAFLIGDKNQPPIPEYCEHFAKAGYAVASIDYRIGFNTVSTGSCERAVVRAIQDLRAAIRYLCQRANIYKIDTGAIFLTGSSAGCIAGLHSSFARQSDLPNSSHGIPLEPSDLGCIDCSGNNDFNNRVPKTRGILNHWGAILDTNFISTLPEDNVPVISVHGDADALVPYETGHPFSYPVFPTVYGSHPIHRRMNNLGIKNELVTMVGYIHEPWLLSREVLDTAFHREKIFMYAILKPLPQKISGDSVVCLNEMAEYSVIKRDRSKYCFSLSGGGTIVSQNDNKIVIRWTSTGNFTLRARELNLNEVNGDEVSYSIRVVNRPTANFGIKENALSVSISDSALLASTWKYAFGDGSISSLSNPNHTFSAPGSYTITQVVSNNYCTDTAYNTVSVDSCPTANFTFTASNNTVHFQGSLSNGISYVWTFGDGTKDSSTLTPTHVYANTQSYLVGLTITNAKGCKVSGTQIITISTISGLHDAEATANWCAYTSNPHELLLQCKSCTYSIYDIAGKSIEKGVITEKLLLNLEQYSKGSYILKMNNNAFSMSRFIQVR